MSTILILVRREGGAKVSVYKSSFENYGKAFNWNLSVRFIII